MFELRTEESRAGIIPRCIELHQRTANELRAPKHILIFCVLNPAPTPPRAAQLDDVRQFCADRQLWSLLLRR